MIRPTLVAVALCFVFCASIPGQTYKIITVAGGGLPENIPGIAASLGHVAAVATDAAGNVYLTALQFNIILRLDKNGMLTRIAGSGTAGYSGDGGPANSAQLNLNGLPTGVAVDSNGNIYIGDIGNNRVRVVSNGVISTVAGNGLATYSGDGGLAINAGLNRPAGVAVDNAGNLYIADYKNYRVRKVANGIITTVAGNGVPGFGGDGGLAINAQLGSCWGLAVDFVGNLYLADGDNNRIRKVTPQGFMSTIAGNGLAGYSGDGGQATSAALNFPWTVAVDSAGQLYIADTYNDRIRSVEKDGTIATIAGTGSFGYSGDSGPAIAAQLTNPVGVAIDSQDNLYVAGIWRLRKVANGIITTVAGGGSAVGDGGPALGAQLIAPSKIAVTGGGKLDIADFWADRVREVTSGVITTIAGNGYSGHSGDGGPATSAQLAEPQAVTYDPVGGLYIADANYIRKVVNGVITTIGGNGVQGYRGDDGAALSAEFNDPSGLAADGPNSLYIADTQNSRIRRLSNGVVTTVAGNGSFGYSGDGGPALLAELSNAEDVAVDSAGDIYIADGNNNRIRKVSQGVITTVAGDGNGGYGGDNGPATSAQLNFPTGIAVDELGNLYIADWGNHRIRKISNGVMTTIAGTGAFGYAGDGGPATSSQLNEPTGVAVDTSGAVYVSDYRNNRIRMLTASGPSCTATVTASTLSVDSSGGSVIVNIQTTPSCHWAVGTLPSWITYTGSLVGTGPATITLSVAANSGSQRVGVAQVAGRTLAVTSAAAPTVPKILPQFAFGGGWYSALYFANATDSPISFQLGFIADNGQPLTVPSAGGSVITVNLSPHGATMVEGLNAGPLQQGYATFSQPAGVIGYGVFRQTVPGRPDQEAVVPFSDTSTTTSTLIWDNVNLTTSVAILNPGSGATRVTVVVRDSTGQEIGASSLDLAAGTKTAAVLQTLPGLSGIAGQRGSAEFSVNSGNLAVLGLRFGGSAFTSIPTSDR